MFYVDGVQYQEDPKRKLGSGSEGAVYPFDGSRNLCVKLFHEVQRDDRTMRQLAKFRARKVRAICGMQLTLPRQFILPQQVAVDGRRSVVGFVMPKLSRGYFKFLKLLEVQFRTANDIGLKKIAELYARIFEDLAILHPQGIRIQDVNMGCLMFTTALDRAWVDTDSWEYPGYPCLATTELFAHPDLYANLDSGAGKVVAAQPHYDYFAFTVAFCMMAIHGAHPFRMGNHRSVTSLQERAREGITVFDRGVSYPKFLPSPEILSDELLQAIIERLKRKTDEPFDPKFLRAFAEVVVSCKKCNAEYFGGRPHCPRCHEVTMVDVSKALNLLIQEVFKPSGTILFAQVIDDELRLVCRTKGGIQLVLIDDRGKATTIATSLPDITGARYRFFGSCLAVCANPLADEPISVDVYLIEGKALKPAAKTVTGLLAGDSAIFDCSSRFLYRTAGSNLMCTQMFGNAMLVDQPIAQLFAGQSWFTVDRTTGADREVIFGYDRALSEWQWFVVHGNSDGNRFRYHTVGSLPLRVGEKLENFSVYFNTAQVLLVRQTRYRGKNCVRYSIIAFDGSIVDDQLLVSDDNGYEHWENIHGKLFQGSSILHATNVGIVKQTLPGNTYVTLHDTDGVVTENDRLFRFGKSVGVARPSGVLRVSKK